MSIPHLFRCPISLELFTDPVTLSTGQTYDRPSIEKWISSGNLTCPVTMQKLHDLSVVPNHTLSHLIDQWLQMADQHDQFDDPDNCFCRVSACSVSLPSLKQTLESQDSTLEQKTEALEQIRCLSEDLPNKNEGLVQLGFFPLLLGLVFGAKFDQEMMGLVEKALKCALNLIPFCYLGHMNMLLEESKFETFRVLFKEGTSMVKISLCNLIEFIFISSSFDQTIELATKIENETKVLQGLISSLHDYQQNPELSEAGIKAILGLLSSSQGNRCEILIKEGLIHSLVTYILEVEKQEKNLAPKATRVLEMLLELGSSGKEAFLVNDEVKNGVKALVKMVFRVSGDEEGSESAVNSLMILCLESKVVREEAICGGILTQLLFLLQSQCSGRAKTRARMLLKLLRSMWDKDPNHV